MKLKNALVLSFVCALMASGCGSKDKENVVKSEGSGGSAGGASLPPGSPDPLSQIPATAAVFSLSDSYKPQIQKSEKKAKAARVGNYNYRDDGGCQMANDLSAQIPGTTQKEKTASLVESTNAFCKLMKVPAKDCKKAVADAKALAKANVAHAKACVSVKKKAKGSKTLSRRTIYLAGQYQTHLHPRVVVKKPVAKKKKAEKEKTKPVVKNDKPVEPPKVEAPKAEAPKAEAPKAEATKPETPKAVVAPEKKLPKEETLESLPDGVVRSDMKDGVMYFYDKDNKVVKKVDINVMIKSEDLSDDELDDADKKEDDRDAGSDEKSDDNGGSDDQGQGDEQAPDAGSPDGDSDAGSQE